MWCKFVLLSLCQDTHHDTAFRHSLVQLSLNPQEQGLVHQADPDGYVLVYVPVTPPLTHPPLPPTHTPNHAYICFMFPRALLPVCAVRPSTPTCVCDACQFRQICHH